MPRATLIEEVTLTTWPELLDAFQHLKHTWSFRGQEDHRWVLRTTLERSGSAFPAIDESAMLSRFVRRAKPLLPSAVIPPDEDTFSWLAIMQHYGAPTRLLDFTRSPYVALFFAFEKASETRHARAVWALNVNLCQNLAADRLAEQWKVPRSTVWGRLMFDQFNVVSDFVYKSGARAVVLMEPWNLDPRQDAQQTQFMVPGRCDRTFMDNLDALRPCPAVFRKINVPDELRPTILSELAAMNVTAASLFPGLDGFARSMHSHLALGLPTTEQLEQVVRHSARSKRSTKRSRRR